MKIIWQYSQSYFNNKLFILEKLPNSCHNNCSLINIEISSVTNSLKLTSHTKHKHFTHSYWYFYDSETYITLFTYLYPSCLNLLWVITLPCVLNTQLSCVWAFRIYMFAIVAFIIDIFRFIVYALFLRRHTLLYISAVFCINMRFQSPFPFCFLFAFWTLEEKALMYHPGINV